MGDCFEMRISLGLGSNIGERAEYLRQAIDYLLAVEGVDADFLQQSSIIETPAMLPENAPKEWNIPFLNQVVVMQVDAVDNPEYWLQEAKRIEQEIGRVQRGHWSPREIDIDIIAIEGRNWISSILQLPHPQAHHRHFVVQPLCEIWQECMLGNGLTAQENMELMRQIWVQPS